MNINPDFIIWFNQAGLFEIVILTIITISFTLIGLLFLFGIFSGLFSKDSSSSPAGTDESSGLF